VFKSYCLRQGKKIFDGNTKEGINIYLRKDARVASTGNVNIIDYPDRDFFR